VVTFSTEALELLRDTGRSIHIELPPKVLTGCLAGFQDRPTVRFGEPENRQNYVEQVIQGVTVFLPREMPIEIKGRIGLSSFLGFHRPVLEGWSPL
jgi:hypothetical protein